MESSSSSLPKKFFVPIQHFEQGTNYTCGPASVRMLLDFYEDKRVYDEEKLAMYLKAKPLVGTENHEIVNFFIAYQYHVYFNKHGALEEIEFFVSKGLPVLINYRNMFGDTGHYGVVNGYTEKSLILCDPWNGECFAVPKKDFEEKRWMSGDMKNVKWLVVPIKDRYFEYYDLGEKAKLFVKKQI